MEDKENSSSSTSPRLGSEKKWTDMDRN